MYVVLPGVDNIAVHGEWSGDAITTQPPAHQKTIYSVIADVCSSFTPSHMHRRSNSYQVSQQ